MDNRNWQATNNRRLNLKLQIVWLLNKLLLNILAWVVLTQLFFWMNHLLNPDIGTTGAKFFQIVYQNKYLTVILSTIVATFSWFIEDLLFYRFLSRKSLGIVFLFRVFFLISLVAIVFLVISAYVYHTKIFDDIEEYLFQLKEFLYNRVTIYLFLMAAFISSFINMGKAIKQKVGSNSFLRIVSGYYRKPREEERIFIFIDLISSTKYAEQLGHRRYSVFLQKCFAPLGLLEIKYNAMQYQIIGDEVVLTWPTKKDRNFCYAVKLFYEYTDMLRARSAEFENEFGIIPSFSASINSGKIMVSEVGSLKSEIAFHGDVLNTAARIQKQCKSYQKQMLVTKTFADQFSQVCNDFKVEWVASDKLIGKTKSVDIYAIERFSESENGSDHDSSISRISS